jgi:hypothetical protein
VKVVAARLAERAGIERLAVVHLEAQLGKHLAGKVIRLAAYDNIITKYTKVVNRAG